MFCCLFCSSLFNCIITTILIAFGIKFLIKKLRGHVDLTNEVDISGKTVIVTGASDGIGKATVEEFAARGARVILACRNLQKAERCVEEIRSRTTNGELIVLHLNLSSLKSVRNFVTEFTQKYGDQGLSILVNNAGVGNPLGVRKLTEDGFEESFGVNHLAHFLLTNLLLPQLEKASTEGMPSRIVTVGSGAARFGKLNFDDLMFDKTPFVDTAFFSQFLCNSKLANNLFNLELAKRLRAKKINVQSYAVCPGVVETDTVLKFQFPPAVKIVLWITRFFMGKTPKEGAETTVYCSTSKNLTHHSGEMYRNCEFWDYSKRPKLSEQDAKLLWEKSEKLVTLGRDESML